MRVERVDSSAARRAFAALPRALHPRPSPYIRPLDAGVTRLIDPALNPLFRSARGTAFTAWRGRDPAGRVHALVWPRHEKLHGERVALFGLLDLADDPEAAAALLSAAEDFARTQGASSLRGPYNLTALSDGGLVTSGHTHPPPFGTAWSPPYTLALLERLGYRTSRRATTWLNPDITALDPRSLMRQTPEDLGVEVRISTRRRLKDDLAAVREVVSSAFLGAPDFVPPAAEEWEFQFGPLIPFLDPSLVVIAEVRGAMAGVSMGVPDFNQILARLDGSAWHPEAAAFFRSPPCPGAVFLLSALHRSWQGRGVGRVLNAGLLHQAKRAGYASLAGTWIDERNIANRRQVESLGMRPLHELAFVERALG